MMSHDEEETGRFEELVAFCLEAERLGVPVDKKLLARQYPDEADALADFLQGHLAMRAMVGEAIEEGASEKNGQELGTSGGEERAPTAEQAGVERLGRYRLVEEIGRGGMGVVYKAWQDGVNRLVALKVVSSGPFASAEELRRFQIEAEAAASLNHPGLVPIYEVDVYEGRPFYSMEYVAGTSLAEAARRENWSLERITLTVAEVADSISYAHSHGVIHRDLKPANILIDPTGRPRVTDFGLAKRLPQEQDAESTSSYSRSTVLSPSGEGTRTGAVLGTPAYMAPEQAAGHKGVGPGADIYGLGAILYDLVTGQPPFRGANPIETLSLVLDGRLVRVRQHNPQLPEDLAIIIEKCLERKPGDRYHSARELAEDLRRFVAGEPIHARAMSLWGRVTRAVGQSRHVSHFRHWGATIIGFGVVVFLAHAVMQWIAWSSYDSWWLMLSPRGVMFVVLLVMLRWSRAGSMLPRDAVERLVWVVWTGYFLAYGALMATSWVGGGDALAIYPLAAILGGMAFFTLGCHVWGACYLVGLGFFIASPWLAHVPEYSVIGFGLLWGISLGALGWRYRRLNRVLPADVPTTHDF